MFVQPEFEPGVMITASHDTSQAKHIKLFENHSSSTPSESVFIISISRFRRYVTSEFDVSSLHNLSNTKHLPYAGTALLKLMLVKFKSQPTENFLIFLSSSTIISRLSASN